MRARLVLTKTGTQVFLENEKLPISFTLETPAASIERFRELVSYRGVEILDMVQRYNEKIRWNLENRGQGKDWPIFSQLDRVLSQIQKSAGIVDS